MPDHQDTAVAPRYCKPECRNSDYNECADCWHDGGNPALYEPTAVPAPEILDACCGGRMWWWDKAHPLAVHMDTREAPPGSRSDRPNWQIAPDVLGDFRAMPFVDATFRLVVFDPPHIVRPNPSGRIAMQYGALPAESEQDDLRRGFAECWRVLTPGGTLVFKWAGALDRVAPHFPAVPTVGSRNAPRGSKGLGTRWFIFYKPLGEDARTAKEAELAAR